VVVTFAKEASVYRLLWLDISVQHPSALSGTGHFSRSNVRHFTVPQLEFVIIAHHGGLGVGLFSTLSFQHGAPGQVTPRYQNGMVWVHGVQALRVNIGARLRSFNIVFEALICCTEGPRKLEAACVLLVL